MGGVAVDGPHEAVGRGVGASQSPTRPATPPTWASCQGVTPEAHAIRFVWSAASGSSAMATQQPASRTRRSPRAATAYGKIGRGKENTSWHHRKDVTWRGPSLPTTTDTRTSGAGTGWAGINVWTSMGPDSGLTATDISGGEHA